MLASSDWTVNVVIVTESSLWRIFNWGTVKSVMDRHPIADIIDVNTTLSLSSTTLAGDGKSPQPQFHV